MRPGLGESAVSCKLWEDNFPKPLGGDHLVKLGN